MATLFSLADADDMNLLNRALVDWHKALADLGARVQILFAANADPESDAPAVKHGGYPARATIRVVPLKDRLTKGYDAEMLVDHGWWRDANEARRLALLDHELSHLEPVAKDGAFQLDDLGRPKLKLRKGDWNAGDGFAAVVERHGNNAAEFENLRDCWGFAEKAKAGELTHKEAA